MAKTPAKNANKIIVEFAGKKDLFLQNHNEPYSIFNIKIDQNILPSKKMYLLADQTLKQ